jgi:phosphonate transport system substrate-binding protein
MKHDVTLAKRLRFRIATLAVCCGISTAGLAADPKVYRFSPVNQHSIALTAAYWNPIVSYVSEKSGVTLELKIGRTSADTTAFVLAQEVEFVFSNHLFSPQREKLGWQVFGRRLTPPVYGQIIVTDSSAITDLAQLVDKPIAYPGPEALVAYKLPAAHLTALHIPTRTVFGGNMDGALEQLFSGKVAAVGVNAQLAQSYARRMGLKYRVLWSSPPMLDLALMVSSKVAERDKKAVAKAFLEMHLNPKGLAILTQASAHIGLTTEAHFVEANGSEYAAYRDFYRTAPAFLR